jgi:perosamine synthetase
MGREEQEAAAAAIASGWVSQGPKVVEFEEAVAGVVGAEHAIAVSSATAGLHLALLVAGVGPGDEVVVPSLSFIATASSVVNAGGTPVFADVDPRTQNVTAATIAPALSPRTRAVMVVHQGGLPADVPPIKDICEPLGIAVIEDAACAIGSTAYGRPIGSDSTLAVFSFHGRKVLTTGEGGMIVTSRPEYDERLRRLRDHGVDTGAYARHAARSTQREAYLEVGFNFRMTDMQGAIGVVQVARLPALLARRRELAERYREALQMLPGILTAADPSYGHSNFQSFWMSIGDELGISRDALLEELQHAGVSTRRGFMAAHLEPAYADSSVSRAPVPLPATERLTLSTLILPLHHGMDVRDVDHVTGVVRAAAETSLASLAPVGRG